MREMRVNPRPRGSPARQQPQAWCRYRGRRGYRGSKPSAASASGIQKRPNNMNARARRQRTAAIPGEREARNAGAAKQPRDRVRHGVVRQRQAQRQRTGRFELPLGALASSQPARARSSDARTAALGRAGRPQARGIAPRTLGTPSRGRGRSHPRMRGRTSGGRCRPASATFVAFEALEERGLNLRGGRNFARA